MKKTCECWTTVNRKLTPIGVKLSEKLRALRPTPSLDLVTVYQLPTEPLGGGKFKGGMPRYIAFPFCPFCGQKLPTAKGAV